MMFSSDRDQLRQFYCNIWQKHHARVPLEPLEGLIRDVILMHPEYHALLDAPEQALAREYFPESGHSNPFLHMGLHLALQEQIGTDRPAGIRELAQRLRLRYPDPHDLEHRMMECLAEMIWRSQRDAAPPDETAYLACLHRLASDL